MVKTVYNNFPRTKNNHQIIDMCLISNTDALTLFNRQTKLIASMCFLQLNKKNLLIYIIQSNAYKLKFMFFN